VATTIKNSFKTVTAEDLLRIRLHTPREVVSALSGLTPKEAQAITPEVVLALYELYSFLDDVSEAALHVPPDWQPPNVDVAAESFEKIELAKRSLSSGLAPYRLFLDLVKIYFGADYVTGPAAPLIALGALIHQDLNQFFERFKDLAGEPPTEEEQEAGIEALHSFGPYGIAENIAAKYGCKPYEVFKWGAEEVYLELTYQLAKNRFQENLREIERRKSAAPKK
jgi:hypothetical protein